MDKKSIQSYGKTLGFNGWQAEKDYLQHLVLRKIYSVPLPLAFKGGTCLQKVYGLPRFSRDLDFHSLGDTDLSDLCDDLGDPDIALRAKKLEKSEFSENYLFEFYSEEFKNSLTIQVSLREALLRPKKVHTITPGYAVPPYTLWAMDLEEILAEKMRALLTRGFPRDLYDVWYLLHIKRARPGIPLINAKLERVNQRFGQAALFRKIRGLGKEWDAEMSGLVPAHPKFKEVLDDLKADLADFR